VGVQDYPLYYESEGYNEEEYAKRHSKFVRKTEPAISKACVNLVDTFHFLKEIGAKNQPQPAE